MKRVILVYILIFLLNLSCNFSPVEQVGLRLEIIDSMSIDSVLITKILTGTQDEKYFINGDKKELIVLNEKYQSFNKIEYSQYLRHILDAVRLNDSLIFISGIPDFIVQNLYINKLSTFKKDLDMTSNFLLHKNLLIAAGINMRTDIPVFSLNQIKYEQDSLIIENIVDIEMDEYVENYLLTGHLVKVKNNIIFIYDWFGKYFIIKDSTYNIKAYGELPFSGNVSLFDDYVENPPFYQAYSADVFNDSLIFVLREVDFESVNELNSSEDLIQSTLRKRVHVFTENMELVGSLKLLNKATQIKVLGDKLLTLHHEDNTVYTYQIIIDN